MNSIEKMAQLFKERNNPSVITITTGTVISASPLRVQWGDLVILEAESLVVASLVKTGFTVEYTDENETGTTTKEVTIVDPLEAGDEVILVPDVDLKRWYIIDKVG